MEKAKEAATGFGEKVQDAASYIGEQAKAAGSSAMHSAEDAASYVGKKADDGLHAVGSGLKSFGDTVRHTAPQRDMLKDSVTAEDMTNLIKRNPIPALFIGIGVGFLLGRALSARSH